MESANLSHETNLDAFFSKKKTVKLKDKTKVLMINALGVKENIVLEKGTSLKRDGNFIFILIEKEEVKKKELKK